MDVYETQTEWRSARGVHMGGSEEKLTGESDDKIQSDQHQPLHVVRFSVLDQQVDEEDGDE
jgi:hypothetical protein